MGIVDAALRPLPISLERRAILHRRIRVDRTISILFGRYTAPNFIIVGAQKSGTTSLWNYLVAHPNVKKALVKEVHFFEDNYDRGRNFYLGFFPSKCGENQITGEASPYYLFHPAVPQRMANMLPDAKIVVVLRNPIERAYSHYNHSRRLSREPSSFEDVVGREVDLINAGQSPVFDTQISDPVSHRRSYVSRGIYAPQLLRWTEFYSSERTLVIKSEDLFADPDTYAGRVVEFLGLSSADHPLRTFPHVNRGTPGNHLAPDMRRLLRDFYRPYNQELAKLVDFDISDWDQ